MMISKSFADRTAGHCTARHNKYTRGTKAEARMWAEWEDVEPTDFSWDSSKPMAKSDESWNSECHRHKGSMQVICNSTHYCLNGNDIEGAYLG